MKTKQQIADEAFDAIAALNRIDTEAKAVGLKLLVRDKRSLIRGAIFGKPDTPEFDVTVVESFSAPPSLYYKPTPKSTDEKV